MKVTITWIFCFSIYSAAIGCSHVNIQNKATFKNPFVAVTPIDRNKGTSLEVCPVPPAPVVDILSQTYYKDSHHSIIDEEKHQKSREMVQPLRIFNNQIVRLADRLRKFEDPNADQCLFTWLITWAKAGALHGDANYQGEFERKWNLSGIALAYLKIENLVRWTPDQKSEVVSWLQKVALRVRIDYDQKTERQSRRNNHIYWAGLSVMAAALSTGDKELYEWGLSKARLGIKDITAGGFLPEELDRARRARHYQSFALQALTMMAFISNENGTDLYALNDNALHRLAAKTIEGYLDSSVFERETSIQQEPIDPNDFQWTFAYLFVNPNKLSLARFELNNSSFSPWLGGNLHEIFLKKAE